MQRSGALLRTADAADFVYDPDAEARDRTDLRAFTIIGATLVLALAVTLWFWRRRRAPAARPAPEAAATSAPAQPAIAAPAGNAGGAPAREAAGAAPEQGDLNPVMADLERAIRRRLPRRLSLRLSLLPELWRCRADGEAVRSLVLDLADAAAAGLKGDGELVIGTRNFAFDEARVAVTPGARPGEWVRVTVRDNGPGLSDDALDRVFDPAATTRPSAALAAETMRRLGGFARVESAEGVGTAVHLYFGREAAPARFRFARAAE